MNSGNLVIVQNRETQFDAPLYSLIHQTGCFPLSVIYTTPLEPGGNQDAELGFSPSWDHLSTHTYSQRTLRHTGPLAIWRLARELRRQTPSLVVICGYYPRSHLLLAVLLRLRGQRIGLRSDNTLAHTTFHGVRGRLRRFCVGAIQRLFHTWHPVGDQALAYLRTLSGSNRPSYRFAYAVDNDWFAAQSTKARLNRAQFLVEQDWPHDAFVVLGIMKWAPREDPITLVAAFQQLRERVPRARLILVGDGPLRDAVAAACQALGNSVLCPGYVPYSQLPDWYGRADIFVHPAPDEPWGVSVTEALACGVPVIAAEGVGAAREVLQEDGCGGTFPNHNAEALMDALLNRATDVEASQHANACREAADRWHYRQTIEQFKLAMQTAEACEVYRHA
jgi:glycosyltransferase involved in cell wall biosynthesis